jgi:hypothetical protein
MSLVGYSGDLETILRYAVPGALLIPSISIFVLRYDPSILPYLVIALALMIIPIGYIVYQLWLLIFISTGMNENGYCREGRKNLVVLREQFEKILNSQRSMPRYTAGLKEKLEKINIDIENYVKKFPNKRQACARKKLILILAYYAWESWVYDKAPEGHFGRARRLWLFYHSDSTSALAAGISIALLVLVLHLHSVLSISFMIFYGFITVFMIRRAKQMYREAVTWETMMLNTDTGNIEEMLLRMLNFYETDFFDIIKNINS